MRGDIKINDLLNLIANEVGGNATPNMVKKYLNATEKVILKELKLNKRINFYEFGAFEVIDVGGYDRKIGNLHSGYGTTIKYIKPKTKIKFIPSSTFNKIVNEYDYEIPDSKKRKSKKEKRNKEIEHNERRKKVQPTMDESIVDLLNNI